MASHEFKSLAIHGGLGAGFGAVLLGASSTVDVKIPGSGKVLLKDAPIPLVTGAAAAVGALVVDGVHKFILPHIPGDRRWHEREALLLGTLSSAAGFFGALYLMNDALPTAGLSVPTVIATGAGIEAGSAYLQALWDGESL